MPISEDSTDCPGTVCCPVSPYQSAPVIVPDPTPVEYWNQQQTAGCLTGSTGTPSVVAANTISSTVSQEDADAKAMLEAMAGLTCVVT